MYPATVYGCALVGFRPTIFEAKVVTNFVRNIILSYPAEATEAFGYKRLHARSKCHLTPAAAFEAWRKKQEPVFKAIVAADRALVAKKQAILDDLRSQPFADYPSVKKLYNKRQQLLDKRLANHSNLLGSLTLEPAIFHLTQPESCAII